MTKAEVQELFKRIKSNYPSFVVDDYKFDEWYEELEDYDTKDINMKLEEHLRNEQYGHTEPKVYFLTKYLTKIQEKQNMGNIIVKCPLCHKSIRYSQFKEHHDRCSAVEYLVNKIETYKIETKATKEQMYELENDKFDIFYDRILKIVYSRTTDEREKKIIENILYGGNNKVSDIIG